MRKTKPNSKWLARRKMFKHSFVEQKKILELKSKITQLVRHCIVYTQLTTGNMAVTLSDVFKYKHLQKTKVSRKIARTLVYK